MNTKRWTLFGGLLATILAVMVFVAPAALAAPGDGQAEGCGPRGGHGLIDTAAEVIGITPEELIAELRDGEDLSIADVAANHDVSADSIVEAVVTQASERLAEMVDSGRLTQEEADEKLAEIEQRVTERINQPFTLPPEGQRPQRDGNDSGFQRGQQGTPDTA